MYSSFYQNIFTCFLLGYYVILVSFFFKYSEIIVMEP